MKKFVFWGGTGQARVLAELVQGNGDQVVALVDNRMVPSPVAGVQCLHGEVALRDWLSRTGQGAELHCAVAVGGGHGRDRIELLDLFKSLGFRAEPVLHRTAFVAATAELGEGCQVLAQAAVCAGAKLGRAVIVNTAASVDHDCILGDGVHLAPGARLTGEVLVGARSFVGANAVILPRVVIGEDVVIGAGAVVTGNVESGTTVVGNPARPMSVQKKG